VANQAKKVEDFVKRKELALSELPADSIETIQGKDEVNSMLIESIKKRIELLNS
jgi:hypothetical protein